MEVIPGTDLGLTREEESCLKQQLLKICVQNEIVYFMENPEKESIDKHTLFLKFFRAKILEFPLLAMKEKAKKKMEELMDMLPKFLTMSQRATKHDLHNKKMRVIVVANLSSMLRTPLERRHDLRRTREDYVIEEDMHMKHPDDPIERTRQTAIASLTRELARTSLAIFLELEQQGGVENFFAVVKEHKKLEDVPPLYQSFFKYMGKVVAVQMERQYSDPKQVRSLRKLYKLTPVKAVRAMLAITDPKKLLEGLLSLFLARPFGAHNLLQRITSAGTELKHSHAQLKEAKLIMMSKLKRFDAKVIVMIFDQLHKHANEVPLPIVEEEDFVGRPQGEEIVDYDRLVPSQLVLDIIVNANVLTKHEIDTLTEEEIGCMRNVLVFEMRIKDKTDFVELLGTEDMINIVKEIFPIFFEIICTVKRADFGMYFEKYFKAMKVIVKVSETAKEQDVTERIAAYERALENMQKELYAFIHSIFTHDTGGEIYKTFEWYIDILRFVHRREAIDVQKLLLPLSPTEREEVVKEVDSVLEYYKHVEDKGAPPASRPVLNQTRKLLAQPFVEMMTPRLSLDDDVIGERKSDVSKEVLRPTSVIPAAM